MAKSVDIHLKVNGKNHVGHCESRTLLADFLRDHLNLTGMAMVRMAWLLALGKLTVVVFFAIFLVLIIRASIRKAGGCDEALAMALAIGSVISFASMMHDLTASPLTKMVQTPHTPCSHPVCVPVRFR